jgi:hypothetical protein
VEVNSKICTGCNRDLPFTEYAKAKLGKFGLKAKCRACIAKEALIYYERERAKILAYGKKRREAKAGQISIQRAQYSLANKGRFTEYRKQWAKNNPGKVNAKTARRRAARRNAMPKWLTKEQHLEMEAKYIEAARLTKETGIPHEVDHIEPLQGKDRSGLHVPWNLRVVTRTENRHKSRKVTK